MQSTQNNLRMSSCSIAGPTHLSKNKKRVCTTSFGRCKRPQGTLRDHHLIICTEKARHNRSSLKINQKSNHAKTMRNGDPQKGYTKLKRALKNHSGQHHNQKTRKLTNWHSMRHYDTVVPKARSEMRTGKHKTYKPKRNRRNNNYMTT